jgi:hypothetical protein
VFFLFFFNCEGCFFSLPEYVRFSGIVVLLWSLGVFFFFFLPECSASLDVVGVPHLNDSSKCSAARLVGCCASLRLVRVLASLVRLIRVRCFSAAHSSALSFGSAGCGAVSRLV